MKVIVRSGLPGKIRLELEDGSVGMDIDNALTAYQCLHEVKPFMQALVDAANPPTKGKSLAPKGDA